MDAEIDRDAEYIKYNGIFSGIMFEGTRPWSERN
jgi:hypothetical protein